MGHDPVCGMQVDEKMAVATSVYRGQTYDFCANACKTAFDREPERYLAGRGEAHARPRMMPSEASREEAGQDRWRGIIVGAVALVGIALIILGASGLRELMVVGKVAPEMLGRQVGYTTISLALGLAVVIWSLALPGLAGMLGGDARPWGDERPSSRGRHCLRRARLGLMTPMPSMGVMTERGAHAALQKLFLGGADPSDTSLRCRDRGVRNRLTPAGSFAAGVPAGVGAQANSERRCRSRVPPPRS